MLAGCCSNCKCNYFSDFSSTRSCPQGRTTIITLHCEPDHKGEGRIKLPAKCPDGTCDGCNFNFLWASASACPICTENNYRSVFDKISFEFHTVTERFK